jgi:hypothetical protein
MDSRRLRLHDGYMAKTIEIPNVPDELHDAVAARAQREGLSIADYLLQEMRRIATTTSPDEIWEILERIPPLDLGNLTAADLIREGREERTDQILDAISSD